jgi:hypothetical protein
VELDIEVMANCIEKMMMDCIEMFVEVDMEY